MKFWIARDKDGYSHLYAEKPIKKDWYFQCVPFIEKFIISHRLFPEVTFENSPQQVELKLQIHNFENE